MWDSNTPLQLLNSMPKALEDEHLEKLQTLLEADKYKNQLVSGFDLCGMYAPFCYGCNKDNKYPCAVSYVNYLKEKGADVGFATEATDEVAVEAVDESAENEVENNEVENNVEEQVSATEQSVEEVKDVKPEEKDEKRKIRIAIARKKTII